MKDEICCPEFNPEQWQEKEFEWKDKNFVLTKVFTLFYIPINFGGAMRRLDNAVRNAGGNILDNMALSDHTSKWNMNIYAAVDKHIEGAENVTMSGRFISKVYEGDFKETSAWMNDFDEYVGKKNLKIIKTYMWYTTCPKCAKKYGKNYTVIIGKAS